MAVVEHLGLLGDEVEGGILLTRLRTAGPENKQVTYNVIVRNDKILRYSEGASGHLLNIHFHIRWGFPSWRKVKKEDFL